MEALPFLSAAEDEEEGSEEREEAEHMAMERVGLTSQQRIHSLRFLCTRLVR